MFSYSVARISRTAISSSSSRCAYQLAVSFPKVNHQRRRSSSKASTPPNGNQGSPRTRSQPSQQSPQGRRSRKAKNFLIEDEFAHLPSVPPTHHLRPADINISSFFSLHRPISVTTAIPPSTSPASFANIFDSKPPPVPTPTPSQDPFVVVETLGDTIDALEQSAQSNEEQWDENGWSSAEKPMHKKASIPKNVPGRSRSAHLPFSPPPPPEPVSNMTELSGSTNSPRTRRSKTSSRPRSRSWTTTIVVTEFTASSGSKTYSAASTPLTRVPAGEPVAPFIIGEPNTMPQLRRQRRRSVVESRLEELTPESITPVEEPTQPLTMEIERPKGLAVVYNRVERSRGEMLAISVRRQRKLKMKKHKYKKLRKRTRNLRRKLGKL